MKKLLLLTSALLVLTAAAASAQVNLAWRNCITQAAAVANEDYLCDGSRNGFPHKGVASFVSPANLGQFVGIQAVVDIKTNNATLPDWWRVGTGDCRDGNFSFPVALTGIGTGSTGVCQNPWLGGSTGGGFAFYFENKGDNPVTPTPWPGYGRIKLAMARDTEKALLQGQQYIAGAFNLDTFGDDGSCPGCLDPACLVLNAIELYQTSGAPPQDIYILSAPATRQWITWQGGAVGGSGCPGETPTQNKSWGSVKSLYR